MTDYSMYTEDALQEIDADLTALRIAANNLKSLIAESSEHEYALPASVEIANRFVNDAIFQLIYCIREEQRALDNTLIEKWQRKKENKWI